MKTKIQIKSILGKVLFEYEKENNSVKDTLIEAIRTNIYLQDADLQDADLRGADLQGAYLRGADLRGAYLRGAYLQDAYLQDANLQDADLRGAYLRGAYLQDIKIKQAIVITGLYNYVVIPFISEDNKKYVKMGCYTRAVDEWDADFWNNPNEFPNDRSEKSKLRLFAYETAKRWFEIIN